MNKLTLVVLGALVSACGGGGSSADARPRIDAAGCSADADYGSPTWVATLAEGSDTDPNMAPNPEFLVARGQLNADVDQVAVELYADYPIFNPSGEIATGTYALTGDELNYATCGVCVRLFTEIDDSGYFATAGSVTITTVGPVGGNLDVTINDIAFQHVNIDPNSFQSTPHPDGCTSALTTGQITGTIAQR